MKKKDHIMTNTQLVLLGTGTPNIEPYRYQSSLAVIADGHPYLVDCGGGAVQRMAQAVHEKGIDALKMTNLTHLFLTHLHPDHTTGLADLIIAPWVLDRDAPLHIVGPTGTQSMVDHLLAAYAIGIGEHRDGLAPINHPLKLAVDEIDVSYFYEDKRVKIQAFPVSHGGLTAYGYKFITADKTIVISGDTCPTERLIEQAMGCDILVHEVYSAERWKQRSEDWKLYHQSVHTSTTALAHIAKQVQPGLIVLVHQLYWGATEAELLSEIQAIYDGPVVSGHDLDVF